MTELIAPYRGLLHDGMLAKDEKRQALEQLPDHSWTLTQRQLCDAEMILTGAFSPLQGFMSRSDYQSCLDNMTLANGCVWPIPITLDVSEEFADKLSSGDRIVCRDSEGFTIALMTVKDIWHPDKQHEAKTIYGTTDTLHPGVQALLTDTHPVYLSGTLEGLHLPLHFDFPQLRLTPSELRNFFHKMSWSKVIGFQTRNPIHKAHYHLTLEAVKQYHANLLIHPAVGQTMLQDLDRFTRVRCYEAIMKYYPEQTTKLSLCPLAMRMAGPREAVWHAIIRRNYGCSHFIVGRDHAGVSIKGQSFYETYQAQALIQQYQDDIGVTPILFEEMQCLEKTKTYVLSSEVSPGEKTLNLSGSQVRKLLSEGIDIPNWYSHPEVVQELKKVFPARTQQGFTLFFTGLPSAGKSTLAKACMMKLNEIGSRKVSLLDGDVIRKLISSNLGFSKEDRELNLMRVSYIAAEITKHGGIAICAAIAPYLSIRDKIRRDISSVGGFIEIYCATPIEVCEARDEKGNYQAARQGKIKQFTGVDDPYEPPENPQIILDTSRMDTQQSVQEIVLHLESEGYL